MCQLQLQETQGLTDAFDLTAIAKAAAIVGDCVPDGNWISFISDAASSMICGGTFSSTNAQTVASTVTGLPGQFEFTHSVAAGQATENRAGFSLDYNQVPC